MVRGRGAKVNVGAGHATFTGLRTVKKGLILIEIKKLFLEQMTAENDVKQYCVSHYINHSIPFIFSSSILSRLPSSTRCFIFIFSRAAPTRLRSRRTAASAGWLKRNLCTPPKVITVPGDTEISPSSQAALILWHRVNVSWGRYVYMLQEESICASLSVCACIIVH